MNTDTDSRPDISPAARAADAPRRKRRRLFGDRGQSMVEFALIAPLFFLLLMSIVDFGWALKGYITATNSAREGARLGITGATSDKIVTRTVDTSAGLLSSTNVSVTNAQGKSGEQVSVHVAYTYHYITPIGSLISLATGGSLPDTLPISSTATMRLE